MINRTVEDRDVLVGFVAICAAILTLALVCGLAVRIFIWMAGL